MTGRLMGRYLALLVLAILAAWATVQGYRGYVDRWEGSLRAPLIAGSIAGIAFIVVGSLLVSRADSRDRAARGGADSKGRPR